MCVTYTNLCVLAIRGAQSRARTHMRPSSKKQAIDHARDDFSDDETADSFV